MMNPLIHYGFLLLFPSVILVHLYVAPFTKVEESFNMQAAHDIIRYGVVLSKPSQHLNEYYDHVNFPGAVPRTFVGALLLSQISLPFTSWARDMFDMQYIVRGILGLANAAALWSFTEAVNQAFGRPASYWFVLLQTSQFHVMFYASRTLPNMFAFVLSTFSLRYLITSKFGSRKKRASQVKLSLYLMTIAGVVFRSELAILVGTISGMILLHQPQALFRTVIPAGMVAATAGLWATVLVDSFFWQRFPLWPEWVAFRFNTIEGKSSDWGTSPWHFYFTNAMPRLLLNPMAILVCIPVALGMRATRKFSTDLLLPLLAFVCVYSILPHKEWRFILYIIPGFTAVAAAGAGWIWVRRSKTWVYRLLSLALISSVLASYAVSAGLLYISSLNYPGGQALQRLHLRAEGSRSTIRVHLDDLTCQTGVTRFLQKPARAKGTGTNFIYDKEENKTLLGDPAFWATFDYVLTEDRSLLPQKQNWVQVDSVEAYAGFTLLNEQPPRFDWESSKLSLVMLKRYPEWQMNMMLLWKQLEFLARSHLTKGRWLAIKTEPRIFIFENRDKLSS